MFFFRFLFLEKMKGGHLKKVSRVKRYFCLEMSYSIYGLIYTLGKTYRIYPVVNRIAMENPHVRLEIHLHSGSIFQPAILSVFISWGCQTLGVSVFHLAQNNFAHTKSSSRVSMEVIVTSS